MLSRLTEAREDTNGSKVEEQEAGGKVQKGHGCIYIHLYVQTISGEKKKLLIIIYFWSRGLSREEFKNRKEIIIFPLIYCLTFKNILVFTQKINTHKYELKIIGEILEQSSKKAQSPACLHRKVDPDIFILHICISHRLSTSLERVIPNSDNRNKGVC